MSQLGQLENNYTRYEEEGAKILAIAVQSQEEAKNTVQASKAQYPILADSERNVADAYGVYNLFPDICGSGEATSSVFIISQDNQIVWDNIGTGDISRVPSQTILENLPD